MAYCITSSAHNVPVTNFAGNRLNGLALRFYTHLTGGAHPHPNTPLDPVVNIQLGEVFLNDPAHLGSDSAGLLIFSPISQDINCDADGPVAFARILNPNSGVVEWQLDAGVVGTSILLSGLVFTQGGTITILSMRARHPDGS